MLAMQNENKQRETHPLPEEKRRAVRHLCGWAWCIVALLWVAETSYGHDTHGRQEAGHTHAASTQRMPLMTVTERRPVSAATETRVRESDFAVRPHNTAWEMLNNLPGFVAGQHAGGGKAMQYFLRGFDNDHGTDVAISVDGIPVNMVSHAHGQGYADLNFLIPEIVESIDYRKGPYFADSGNFANSGAVNFITKDDTVENSLRAVGGSFNTMRYVGILSPRLGPVQSLIANEVYFTDGPARHGENFVKYNFFGKFTLRPNPTSKLSLWTSPVYRRLGRLGPDPAPGGQQRPAGPLRFARPERGWTFRPGKRESDLHGYPKPGEKAGPCNCTSAATGCACSRTLRFSAVTRCGAMASNSSTPGCCLAAGRSIGACGRSAPCCLRAALVLRRATITPMSACFDSSVGNGFSPPRKSRCGRTPSAAYTQHELFLREWLRFIVGLRGDFFVFDVDDRSVHGATDAPRLQGDATDGIVSPKASLIVSPFTNPSSFWHQTDLFLNFGMGYHSNDARDVVQPGGSGLARSTGAEIGARTRLYNRVELAASLWWLDLGSELVFVGDEGTTEQRGPTRRWGVDVEARAEVLPWLLLDYDLTYADPRFRVTGEAIPLAPTLLMNGGLTAYPVENLSAALRVRFLDDRAANEDRSVIARGYTLIDLLLRYRWRNIELSFDVLNLADTDWPGDAVCHGILCAARTRSRQPVSARWWRAGDSGYEFRVRLRHQYPRWADRVFLGHFQRFPRRLKRRAGRPPEAAPADCAQPAMPQESVKMLAVRLAEGRSVREIAVETELQENTISFHLKQIYQQLGISRQVDLGRLVLSITEFA